MRGSSSQRLGSRLWATFSFYPPGVAPAGIESGLTRYRIDEVLVRAGDPLAGASPGGNVVRIETADSRPAQAPPGVPSLTAATGHLQYTSEAQQLDLVSRSRVAPGAVAVLIPITKSEAWWSLPQDKRAAHFHETSLFKGHTAIGAAFARRIYRRLYHARGLPDSEWDFLTYFEFDPEHRDDFRALLALLRSPRDNPEWDYVERETEIWLTPSRYLASHEILGSALGLE